MANGSRARRKFDDGVGGIFRAKKRWQDIECSGAGLWSRNIF